MYVLRFDHGVVERGAAGHPGRRAPPGPGRGRRRVGVVARAAGALPVARPPSSRGRAPSSPSRLTGRVQHRLARAAGDAVGAPAARLRLRRPALLDRHRLEPPRRRAAGGGVRRWQAAAGRARPRSAATTRTLAAEADQIDRMVAGAYVAMADFALFAAHAMLYFAVVSFAETRQRLVPGTPAWCACWEPATRWSRPPTAKSLRRLRRSRAEGGTWRARPTRAASPTGSRARSRRATWPASPTPGAATSTRWTSTCSSRAATCSASRRKTCAAPCPRLRRIARPGGQRREDPLLIGQDPGLVRLDLVLVLQDLVELGLVGEDGLLVGDDGGLVLQDRLLVGDGGVAAS